LPQFEEEEEEEEEETTVNFQKLSRIHGVTPCRGSGSIAFSELSVISVFSVLTC
jgi:hypothetical protein